MRGRVACCMFVRLNVVSRLVHLWCLAAIVVALFVALLSSSVAYISFIWFLDGTVLTI